MTYLVTNNGPVPELGPEVQRLRGLVQALDDIRRGCHPDKAALASCPRIHDWRVFHRPDPSLTGIMFNHPMIADGRQGLTTGLWVLAPALGYARTIACTYALGKPDPSSPYRVR